MTLAVDNLCTKFSQDICAYHNCCRYCDPLYLHNTTFRYPSEASRHEKASREKYEMDPVGDIRTRDNVVEKLYGVVCGYETATPVMHLSFLFLQN